jgi:lipid II:glycine glycyltransferase (peptidoglycan interpeptide bridge formation enzyme)
VHKIQIPEPRHAPILEESGFKSTEVARHQVKVSGQDTESLETSFPRSVRKAIRKSRKENVEIREVMDRSEIQGVFELYMKTMAHNKAAAKYPIGRFLSIFDNLVPKGLAVILVASWGGRLVGSNTMVCSDDTVHDIQLSYDHDYQHVRPNDALVFDSLQWTMKQRRDWFDFMGSHAGDESLEQFKAKWGAQRSTTCNYAKILSPLRGACWTAIQKMADHPAGGWFIRAVRKASKQGA